MVRKSLATTYADFRTGFSVDGPVIESLIDDLPGDETATLIIEDHTLTVSSETFRRVIIGSAEHLFNWRVLLRKFLHFTATPIESFVISPEFLARLEHAKPLVEGAARMRFHMFGEDRPIIATLGVVFVAFIMPTNPTTCSFDELPNRPLDIWQTIADEKN